MMWKVLLFITIAGATSPPRDPVCKPTPILAKCPANEKWETCPIDCPGEFCSRLWSKIKCPPQTCSPPSCRCKDGFLRHDNTKKCIPQKHCHAQPCGFNEEYVPCRTICPPQSCNLPYTSYLCTEESQKICEPGCDCIKDHFRNSSNICVPSNKCEGPPIEVEPTTEPTPEIKCGKNEEIVSCVRTCPPQSCEALYVNYPCAFMDPEWCSPGCMCKENYRRNSNGICIPTEKCPLPPWITNPTPIPEPICQHPNETYVGCEPFVCPPGRMCAAYVPNCEPCQCKPNYVRNAEGNCVLIADVPPPFNFNCKANETQVACRNICPAQDCSTMYVLYECNTPVPIPCQPGCDCKDGYLRNKEKRCVLKSECPPAPWISTTPRSTVTPVPPIGPPPPTGPPTEPSTGRPPTVPPLGPCPQTTPAPTTTKPPVEAQCNVNETYVPCQFDCPTIFCPENEYSVLIACSPPYPCLPGCTCINNFKRKSTKDRTCIPLEKCPPVACSKPNERWHNCPSSCLRENCENSHKPATVCYEKTKYCQPRCICDEGFYRNASGICVPASECPPITTTTTTTTTSTTTPCPSTGLQCGVNETKVDCTFKCPYHFCPVGDGEVVYACKPPRDCPSGCGCKLGYKYKSFENLTCILAEECPSQPCTSRPNQVWNPCPSCLAESCADADTPSTGVCNELVHNCQPKCVCQKGFYRNESGVCVTKSECQKCKANEVYVPCKAGCPTDYCPTNENQFLIACDPPYPCQGGCICKLNYKLKSYEDLTCIPVTDCPPVNCSRKNEIWSVCPSPCLLESCENARRPAVACDSFVNYCQPRCICADGHFKNENGTCVPECECPTNTSSEVTTSTYPAQPLPSPPPKE